MDACDGLEEGAPCDFFSTALEPDVSSDDDVSPALPIDHRCHDGLCVEPVCGDGVVNTGETCDDGKKNSNEAKDACRKDCQPHRCGDRVKDSDEECDPKDVSPFCDARCKSVVHVDLLLVLDNTPSMAAMLFLLASSAEQLTTELFGLLGRVPNIHLGVTTTDLGTWGFAGTGCGAGGGDWGQLLTGSCGDLGGRNHLVDVDPSGCEVERATKGCASHRCETAHCQHEPGTQLVLDAEGCPRCRNYSEASLEEAITCLLTLPTDGCGYSQPLEAMYRALDAASQSTSFLRDESYLVVLIVTDKDDCSAASPALFDPSLEAELGPLSPYRCFEHGVACEVGSDEPVGVREGCHAREDSQLLQPIARYANLITSLRVPRMYLVSVIAGPAAEGRVDVQLDADGRPEVQPVCKRAPVSALPGIRLQSFVEAVDVEGEMDWAYNSICDPEQGAVIDAIAARMRDDLGLNE